MTNGIFVRRVSQKRGTPKCRASGGDILKFFSFTRVVRRSPTIFYKEKIALNATSFENSECIRFSRVIAVDAFLQVAYCARTLPHHYWDPPSLAYPKLSVKILSIGGLADISNPSIFRYCFFAIVSRETDGLPERRPSRTSVRPCLNSLHNLRACCTSILFSL